MRNTGEEKDARGNAWDVYSNSVSGFLVSLSLCCALSPIALSQNKLRPCGLIINDEIVPHEGYGVS